MKRTEAFDVDKTFDVACEITKVHTLPNGRRRIRGVASGILEDRDGERVSKRAIAEMAMQPVKGMKLVAATHAQNWANEIGDVVHMEVDPETDELIVESELPPEGVDPLADKAIRKMTVEGARMGYSIGGKLTRTFDELAERAGQVVKRKVLDGIRLKHMCLTDTPAYRQSFVEVVAKTVGAADSADEAFTVDEDDEQELADALAIRESVGKAAPPPDDEDTPQGEPEAPAGDAAEATADATPAAAADSPASPEDASTPEPPSDAEEAQSLPKASRHLACPACGEEFAADLPAESPARDTPNPTADQPDTGKTADKETAMDPMEQLRALAATPAPADVEKTEPEAPEATVEKTGDVEHELGDVLKMLGASHVHSEQRMDSIESGVKEGFELVAKTLTGLVEQINSLPQGRRSVARVLPTAAQVEVEKAETDKTDVQKVVDDPKATALDVLKAQNAARGIR